QVERPNLPHRLGAETALCSTAKLTADRPLGVKSARAGRRAAAPHVRFAPTATELMRRREVSRSVKSGFEQSQHGRPYSITSSARVMSVGGTSRPSAVAVLRLMTSSYLVGACTGRSAGFSPLRMRST